MNKKGKSKKKNIWIRAYSTENTGTFYMVRKSKHQKGTKIYRKYDKALRKHVLFSEKRK